MTSLRKILTILALTAVTAAQAVTLDQARGMVRDGELSEALAALDSIVEANPKNAEAEMARAEALVAMARDAEATESFRRANKKGSNDALLAIAEIATREYRLDDAREAIDDYRKYIKRNPRKKLVDEAGPIEDRIDRTRTMLDRVEDIQVIDSLVVDTWRFFDAYRLSPESGSLNSIEVLPMGAHYTLPTVVYRTEDGREMIWAAQDSANNFVLRSTDSLVGDSWEKPVDLGTHLGGGGDANYPFLMPDGVTLYFASDGEGSLGGYDIYIARRDGKRFLQPQNIGMPYNSPYDDYMLAIDEMTGVGWWATDRNRLDDQLTIYIFIPSDLRVNVDIDDPNLIDRARLSSISSTWRPGADYSELLSKVTSILPAATDKKPQFSFTLPDGRVVTRYEQFSNDRAREAMGRYLSLTGQTAEAKSRLAELRQQYADGDTSVGQEILQLERDILNADAEAVRVANDVVKAETAR